MKKLNFGCGDRFAPGWVNIDFNSTHPEVIPHNLLFPLPFPDQSFDAVYSSHTMEHFTREQGLRVFRECFRILKAGGILRVVVPDLESVCREYVAVLDTIDREESRRKYEWIVIELLDQMVRSEASGLMYKCWQDLARNRDTFMIDYVRNRIGTHIMPSYVTGGASPAPAPGFSEKLRGLSFNKLKLQMKKLRVRAVRALLPGDLRDSICDNTTFGEKHKWMYDRHSMSKALKEVGFKDVQTLNARTSKIPGLDKDCLDLNQDGSVHKENSLYAEAYK